MTPSRPGAVSPSELAVRSHLAAFAARVAALEGVVVIPSANATDTVDLRSDLLNGFPYRNIWADQLAQFLALALDPPPTKKGLITDLDDTLWKGIVGDDGPEGVAWDLAGKGRGHGIYQQFLAALAARGVLLAVASKNDAGIVKRAFQRPDILIPPDRFYPLSVHWRPKSESVADIVKTWNIGMDSVVFIDDNPMEVAEVKAAHPAIEVLEFPKDPAKLLELLETLCSRFGRESVTAEDTLRAESIRAGEAWRAAGTGANAGFEDFLAQAQAKVSISIRKSQELGRPFELLNKTNQFNLNGRRYTEAEWKAFLAEEGAHLATISYEDRFGPLGIISIALLKLDGKTLKVPAWVLSCRAFSRRIEYFFAGTILTQYHGIEVLLLDYVPTEKNGPTREFLETLGEPSQPFVIGREQFFAACPSLHHQLEFESDL